MYHIHKTVAQIFFLFLDMLDQLDQKSGWSHHHLDPGGFQIHRSRPHNRSMSFFKSKLLKQGDHIGCICRNNQRVKCCDLHNQTSKYKLFPVASVFQKATPLYHESKINAVP